VARRTWAYPDSRISPEALAPAGVGGRTRRRARHPDRHDSPPRARRIEQLLVYPASGFWTTLRKNVPLKPEITIALRPIDLREPDVLRRLYGDAPLTAGRGLTVGIVDTGVGDHPDLAVAGGANTARMSRAAHRTTRS